MSTVNINDSVLDLLGRVNSSQSVTADTGQSGLGWWPKEGAHNVLVTGIEAAPGKFRFNDGTADKIADCVDITFQYKLIGYSDPEKASAAVKGRTMQLVLQPDSLPANEQGKGMAWNPKRRAGMQFDRLAGFASVILKRDMTSVAQTKEILLAIRDRLAQGPLALSVLFDYREDKKKKDGNGNPLQVPNEEFAQKLLAVS